MDRAVEITFRNTAADPEVEALARREAAKLERYHRPLVGCRVAIERPQKFQHEGNAYRLRVVVTAGTRRPIVVTREPRDSDMHDNLRTIVLGAFKAARRQLQSTVEQRRERQKSADELRALVVRLFPDEDYGFLKTLDGREIYFHRHSVLHDDFERLAVGTEVRFEEHEGDKGPQASSVQIINKPGIRVSADAPAAIEPPRGWQDAGGGTRRGRRRSKRGAPR
jgi:cold shock CspA family protein